MLLPLLQGLLASDCHLVFVSLVMWNRQILCSPGLGSDFGRTMPGHWDGGSQGSIPYYFMAVKLCRSCAEETFLTSPLWYDTSNGTDVNPQPKTVSYSSHRVHVLCSLRKRSTPCKSHVRSWKLHCVCISGILFSCASSDAAFRSLFKSFSEILLLSYMMPFLLCLHSATVS